MKKGTENTAKKGWYECCILETDARNIFAICLYILDKENRTKINM